MGFLLDNVDDIRKGFSISIKPSEINPTIAQDEFWDLGSEEEILSILKKLLVARIRWLDSSFYINLLKHHKINPDNISEDTIDNFPITLKENSKFGPGLKDFERKYPFSLMTSVGGYIQMGSNTGSTGDIRIPLPNTKSDLCFEHNRMAGIFKQFPLTRFVALNFYNPATLGADTFLGAVNILKGTHFYVQPGYDLKDLRDLVINCRKQQYLQGGINILLGVSRAPGDPTGRKSPLRIEDFLDHLIYSDYIKQFTPENPFLIYVVGSAISSELIDLTKEFPEIILAGAYGLQEGRPLASAFNSKSCKHGIMHMVQFPYLVQIVRINNGRWEILTNPGETGQIMISTPLKEQSTLIHYVTEDIGTIGICKCGRFSITLSDVKRISGELLTGQGCRA